MYAPIALFAFNRLEPLKRCVASLLENSEAAESAASVRPADPAELAAVLFRAAKPADRFLYFDGRQRGLAEDLLASRSNALSGRRISEGERRCH